jgi:hypothetical protein
VPGVVQGYVFREACSSTETISQSTLFGSATLSTTVAGDFVCVPPATRAAIWAQNAGNPPFAVTGTGQPFCNYGYVWREACGPNDKVGRAFVLSTDAVYPYMEAQFTRHKSPIANIDDDV